MNDISNFLSTHNFHIADLALNGEIHRFSRNPGEKKNAWYIGFSTTFNNQDFRTLIVGDWKTGEKYVFNDKEGKLSKKDLAKFYSLQEQVRKRYLEEKIRIQDQASERAKHWWSTAKSEDPTLYTLSKKLSSLHGARSIVLPESPEPVVYVPMSNFDGELRGLQRIYANGQKLFGTGQQVNECFFKIGTRETGTLIVAEGFATGISIFEATGLLTFCTFSRSNLKNVALKLREKYSRSKIVIACDDDFKTPGNPGKADGMEAAAKCGGLAVLPIFKDPNNRGTDFNDLHCLEGIDAVQGQLKVVIQSHDPALAVRPPFQLSDSHVLFIEIDPDGDSETHKVCSRVEVHAFTRNEQGNNWGRLLAWRDSDKRLHEWPMPMNILAGDGLGFRERLLDRGVIIEPGRKARDWLHTYVSTCQPQHSLLCVDKTGWHFVSGERHFVLPTRTFGSQKVLLQDANLPIHYFNQRGTLEEWQTNVGVFAVGNPVLILAMSVPFASVLLDFIDMEGGGIHFCGGSSIGKTVALTAAGSILGGGGVNGFLRTWRATANGLESIAALHNDSLLILDELAQIDPKDAGEAVYTLSNGNSKNRAKRDGSHARSFDWKLLFLSSGEIDLSAKLSEYQGTKIKAGQEVRMITLRVDAIGFPIIQNFHGFDSAKLLSEHISKKSKEFYGTAIQEFISKILQIGWANLRMMIQEGIDEFERKIDFDGCSDQLRRAMKRLSLAATAGRIAQKLEILPWSSDTAFEGVEQCVNEIIKDSGANDPHEVLALVSQVCLFFERHSESRFTELHQEAKGDTIDVVSPDHKTQNRAGYKLVGGDGEFHFFVSINVYETELCRGFPKSWASKVLITKGLLLPGTDKKRPTTKQRIPGVPKLSSFYRFSSSVLEGVHD